MPDNPRPWKRCLGLLGVIAVAAPAATAAAAATFQGTVNRVVDGDTIHAQVRGFDDTIRVIGIDTPETKKPGTPVQCGGPKASAETKRLLPAGTQVRLVTDPTQDTRDRYGRLLAYVYKPGRWGATGSVNYALVAGGFAKVYVFENKPFQYATAFFRAQSRAQKLKNGLWGRPATGTRRSRSLADDVRDLAAAELD